MQNSLSFYRNDSFVIVGTEFRDLSRRRRSGSDAAVGVSAAVDPGHVLVDRLRLPGLFRRLPNVEPVRDLTGVRSPVQHVRLLG